MSRQLSTIAIPLLVCIVLCIQLWPFTQSFRQNADDNLYHSLALSGDLDSMIGYTAAEAEVQGRIGKFFSAPIKFAANYLLDHYLTRVGIVLVFFSMYVMTFRYIDKVCHTVVTPLATLVALALLPLVGNGHMPPNAFPLAFSLPFLLFLGLRMWLVDLRWDQAKARIIIGKLALLPLILNNEYTIILATLFALLEAWYGSGPASGIAGGGSYSLRSRAAQLAQNQKFHLDILVILLAAVLYIAYRLVHPSDYSGNQIDQQLSVASTLTVQLLHVMGGLAPYYYTPALMNSGTEAFLWAGLLSSAIGAITWRCSTSVRLRRPATLLAIGLTWAFSVSLPVALSSKYQLLCLKSNYCTHFDARIAYPGLVLAICGLLGIFYSLVRRAPVSETPLRLLVTLGIAVFAGTTFLSNLQARDTMILHEQGHVQLQKFACLFPTPGPVDQAVLTAVQANVQWHPANIRGLPHIASATLGDEGKQAYLKRYLQYRRNAGFACAEPSPLTDEWRLSGFTDPPGGLLMLGWQRREAWGQWSNGHEAMLIFAGYKREQLPRGIALQLSAYATADTPEQRMSIYRNGELYCNVTMGAAPEWLRIAFKPMSAEHNSMVIDLSLPDAKSPGAVGEGADYRILGAALHAMSAVVGPGEKIPEGCKKAGHAESPDNE